jgi:hypothetical protein
MSEEAPATRARGSFLITPFGQGMENRPQAPATISQEVFAAAGAVLASLESVAEHGAGDDFTPLKIRPPPQIDGTDRPSASRHYAYAW